MIALLVVVGLAAAWVLLRMWEASGEPPDEEAVVASPADAPFEPPDAGTRVVAIVAALFAGFVCYVGIPLVMDGLMGGDDGPPPVCITGLSDVTARDGTPAVQVSFGDCDSPGAALRATPPATGPTPTR